MRSLIYILVLAFLLAGCGFHQKQVEAIDPMRVPVRMRIPNQIKTVGDASQYYAKTVGYRLITSYPAPSESAGIASNPINLLAPTDTVEVFPIREGILMLLHDSDRLVIDREHKLFSFEKGISE
ncbi:MAG: hypothetical protein BA871_11630 [Desulfuromonadales bacterium C00003096]|nr:MAG: hypothetical protein BA871_11630 [Desulfuromonadales bacterium C00003096]